MWHILPSGRAVRQRKRDAVARHGSPFERGRDALAAKRHLGSLGRREPRERLRVAARNDKRVTCIDRTEIEKRDYETGLKYYASWRIVRENLAEDTTHVRLLKSTTEMSDYNRTEVSYIPGWKHWKPRGA